MDKIYSGKQYQFYSAAVEHIDKDDSLGRVRKMMLKRRLKRPRFLEMAMSEYEADVRWQNPDNPEEVNFGNIDWNLLLDVLLTLLKLWL